MRLTYGVLLVAMGFLGAALWAETPPVAIAPATQPFAEKGFKSIFNGKDFDGWVSAPRATPRNKAWGIRWMQVRESSIPP